MWRILRAFAWLRWRVLINSLERRGSRDVIERFSSAFDQLGPAIAAVLMLPSAAGLAAVGGYAGWTLGHGEPGAAFALVRFVLLAAFVLAVLGPILLPGTDRTNAVRLLLLPIPRNVLYLTQSISAFADPWILLAAAVVVAVPAGIASAGDVPGAVFALAAGAVLLSVLAGTTQLVTSTVHLIVRDRRRAELMMLVIVVFLPLLGMLPGLLGAGRHRAPQASIEQPGEPHWWSRLERTAFAAVPSELYSRAVTGAASEGDGGAGSLAVLTGAAAALHALALMAFGRVLDSPGSVGAARTGGTGAPSRWRVPLVGAAVSAVAVNQLRLALRTPRGRATLLLPIVVFGLFAVMMIRGRTGMDFGPVHLQTGLALASYSAVVSLLAILPLAMNQFAIDRSGLTMALLVPLDTAALLRGKAIGNALIVSIPATICLAAAAILSPSGDPMLWLCIPLTLVSGYLIVAPLAAILSAIFPRPVDLNSIGRNSNAHGAAGLLGMLCCVGACAPGLAVAVVTAHVTGRSALAPVAVTVWMAVCAGVSFALFRAAEAVFDRRRENLALTSVRPPS
jgi:hypothetical protein